MRSVDDIDTITDNQGDDMALHTDLSALVQGAATQAPPLDLAAALPAMRAQMRAVGDAFSRPDAVETQSIDLGACPGRLYRPADGPSSALLLFIHGGGWIFGDLDTHDAMCAHIAHEAGCAVLAVGYCLAPEHPFPAGLDNCDDAYRWGVANAETLGIDPARVAIGGESAGANLAAAVTLRRRARGEPQPLFQILVHPLTDFRLIAPSIAAIEGPGITRDQMVQMRAMYLGADGDPADPEASPLLATSHADLAPAIVLTAECDPLRDDGEAYALALATAGVETLIQRLPGLPHGFLFLPAEIPVVADAYRLLGSLIRRYAQRR
ncbi:alpha/beta hydrolase [Sphingomonas sp. LB2R24]|uniref:alpha/beta hydrolase n=1 Tax=Sphingomonas sorbitolis TaxID=3096165 RepID=UPI002FCBF686